MIFSSEVVTSKRVKGYPKLRQNKTDKSIVLFSDSTSGTVLLATEGYYKVGYHTRNWTYGEFEDYNGSLMIEND